jgi:hypothetical protein
MWTECLGLIKVKGDDYYHHHHHYYYYYYYYFVSVLNNFVAWGT